MKKLISVLIAISVLASLCPYVSFADGEIYMVKEDFSAYTVGSEPNSGKASGAAHITKSAKGDKAVELSGTNGESGIAYDFAETKKTFSVCVDMEYTDTWSATSFYITNAAGKSFELAYITEAGKIYTGDGHILTGFPRNRKETIQFVYVPKTAKLSVYINGKCYMQSRYMGANAFDAVSGFGIKVQGTQSAKCCADNILIFEGDKIISKNHSLASGNYSSVPVASEDVNMGETEEVTEGNVYVNRVFGEDKLPEYDKITVTPALNKVEIVKSVFDDNKYIKLTKKESSESIISFAGSPTERYHIVECSFSTDKTAPTGRLLYTRDGNAASMFNTFLNLKSGGSVQTLDGTVVGKIEPMKWLDVGLVIDVTAHTFDVYVNKELKLKAVPFQNNTITAVPIIRTGCDNSASRGTLLVDNIKSYEGNVLREIEAQKYGPITEQDIVPINYLGNKKAVQPYSNTIFANKTKSYSAHDIIAENDDSVVYVHTDDIKTLFGENARFAGAHASRTDYHNLIQTAEASGYKVQNMDTRLFVFDKLQPKLTETQLQSVQRYMYYERPTADDLVTLFKNTSANKHPRILINQEKLDEIKKLYKTDSYMQQWGNNVIEDASYWFGRDVATYQELMDKVDAAITNLSMAYHLTGDDRYAVRAWKFLETLCNLEDWNHSEHYLTTGETTYIVGLGYDWLYNWLNSEQRKFIEENLLKKGVEITHKLYYNQIHDGVDGYLGWWQAESNWNAVCNGGTICGAIALMDVYPEICSEMIENAKKGLEGMLTLYYPHGTYEEGLSYWAYAHTYLTHAIQSLRNSFGSDFNISKVPGLDETGWYIINLTGSTTVMTMGDVDSKLLNNPHIMFTASEYNNKLLMSARLNEMEKLGYRGGAFEMIYYEPELLGEDIEMPLDTYMVGAEVISLRERWYDKGAVYLGASGGQNYRAHGHMDVGSYLVDMAGERFISENAGEDYNAQGGYFTRNRYYFYAARPEGHNLYIINPENTLEYYGMDLNEGATGELLVSKPRGAIGVMDLSRVYAQWTNSAKRGYMLTDDRRSVVVRDEIDLKTPNSEIRWGVHTKADVEVISSNQAVLTQNGKKMLMTVDSNAAEWKFGEGVPETLADITKTVVTSRDHVKAGIRKLEIVAKASGKVNITVKYKLLDDDFIDSNPPKEDIANWIIPDGEVTELPLAEGIYVNGEAVDNFNPTITGYTKLVASKEATVPCVTVKTNHLYEITQAPDFGGDAIIKVFADGRKDVFRTYRVNLYKLPPLEDVDGMRRHPVAEVKASEVPQVDNGPENVIDNSLDTRWAAEGTLGQWIMLELDDVYPIEKVGTSWMSGGARTYKIKLEISTDGVTWETVFDGQTSGTTNEVEYVNVSGKTAKYVRCTGYGNSVNNWNSLTEFVVLGNQR